MKEDSIALGDFIIAKRIEHGLSASYLAEKLRISSSYMCDIEKGRKSSVSAEFLKRLAIELKLSESETELMYDLAAFAQKGISADLPDYIMKHKSVRKALRTAKKNDIPNDKWDSFIDRIKTKT